MRITILLPLLLTACSEPAEKAVVPAIAGDSVAGLYERAGVPDKPSRICIAGEGADLRFGLNSSYEGPESCTAKGRVRRAGSAVRLLIDGEPACSLSATVTATGLTLNRPEGPECSYYCGGNTGLDEGEFAKVGSTQADTKKAVDLVGDPLC